MLLRKRCTQQKLAALMGVSKTTVHHWIVALTMCFHCNSLRTTLTEENKLAKVLIDKHFRDPQHPTKYQDMHNRSLSLMGHNQWRWG